MYDFKPITYADGRKVGQLELPGYYIDHHHSGDKLVVTFEGAGTEVIRPNAARRCWGFDFLEKRGYSVLGVKPKQVDWYRGADLHAFFRSGELRALAGRYSHIFLYGGSMGGYAALAFAEVFPACTSIALNPQTTLNPALVPWEKRFIRGRQQDWSGDFSDGRIGAAAAGKVYVVYDPLLRPDRRHVEMLRQSNLVKLRIPLVGHSVPIWMQRMDILKPTIESILSAELLERDFRKMAEARKKLPIYYAQIAERKPDSCLERVCVDKALALDPKDVDVLLILCKMLLSEKRYDEVISLSRRLPGIKGFEYAVRAYHKLGDAKNADEVLSRVPRKKMLTEKQLARFERLARELGRDKMGDRISEEMTRRKSGRGTA